MLAKPWGWLALLGLLLWDAGLTYRAGAEGNPLWRPIIERYGLHMLFVLIIPLLVFLWGLVKIVGWYARRFSNFEKGEEVVLTTLVIAFFTYDFYITFLFPYFGYFGQKHHYILIPILLLPVLIYSFYVDYLWKKRR